MSRSGYYAWRRRQDHPSQGQLARDRLDQLVAEAFAARKGLSGAVGLTLDLDEQGHTYNRKTVAASMKRQGIKAKAAKKFKATTDSEHDRPVAPNLLGQDFNAEAPNQKWVCDITYLWTGEGWLYLAVVLDLFSRMVVGWAMDKRMKAKLGGKGNCYDNAVAESFFHTLKVEMVHGESFATREGMHRAVFEYIEADYSRTRRHSANGYISPLVFEQKMVA